MQERCFSPPVPSTTEFHAANFPVQSCKSMSLIVPIYQNTGILAEILHLHWLSTVVTKTESDNSNI